jgi:hypothetical protein
VSLNPTVWFQRGAELAGDLTADLTAAVAPFSHLPSVVPLPTPIGVAV